MTSVHVAQRDDVLAVHFRQVLIAPAAEADETEVELFVGRFRLPESGSRDRTNPDARRRDEKLAACVLCHGIPRLILIDDTGSDLTVSSFVMGVVCPVLGGPYTHLSANRFR